MGVDLKARFAELVRQYNEIVAALSQAEQQVAIWKEEQQRLAGQLSLLQELIAAQDSTPVIRES